MSSRRLFVGLMADDRMRDAVEALRSTWAWPVGARMVPRHNLHLTLQFLGEVHLIDEASLVEAMAEVLVPEFQLTFRSSAIWHDDVLVLLAEGTPALDALRRDTGAATAAAGLESDPLWTPHVTLARHAWASQAPAAFEPIVWSPRALSVVWSRRDATGYEVVRSWPMVKGPGALPSTPNEN